jgi:hypothetical protein
MDVTLQLHGLVSLARVELIALTIGLFAVVALQCLTGRIGLNGLFAGPDGRFSPTRLQLLMTTLAVALGYLLGPDHLSSPTQIGTGLAVGGSNLLYLVRKYNLLLG